jgi:lon-related putative ATP-dependent protease
VTKSKPFARDLEVPQSELRWKCEDEWLSFDTTADVEPISGVIGQDDAVEALKFGLTINAPGQNVYVRGLTGTGRASLVEHLLQDISPSCAPAPDRCYVHNFAAPDRPMLVTVPRGDGPKLKAAIDALIEYIEEELWLALNTDTIRARRAAIDDKLQTAIRNLGKPFEEELRTNDLALVPMQVGPVTQPVILPVIDGKPLPLNEFEELAESGPDPEKQIEATHARISEFARKFESVNQRVHEIQSDYRKLLKEFFANEARKLLEHQISALERKFQSASANCFLQSLIEDLVDNRLETLSRTTEFTRLYRVNPVLTHDEREACPVIKETAPTLQNLIGNIGREVSPSGAFGSDHLMIHAGSLLRADGGYLVLEARDVLSEPGAWKLLMRSLRTAQLEILPYESVFFSIGPLLKPQPIPLNVKVILVGDPGLYQLLDAYDPDFPYLFKVLADFESTVPRDRQGVQFYAGVLARITKEEKLLPFDRSGVMAIAEHGARIAGEKSRLTLRFGRLTDVAREAIYLAQQAKRDAVGRDEVYEAVRRGRRRADLPARRYRKRITDGTIRIETTGQRVGQINGLAVIQAGPLTYGFPTRITASIGAGTSGTVNIEREAELSGAIHTKGFYILGGLLRNLLKTNHPLAFSASVAFEQSYGGIDGDSASGAEMLCLLSTLTDIPLRQDLAMTGAIDQLGNIQPIGAVTEKVEGFYAVCRDLGLSGDQGAVIPRVNAGDLMLNPEVLQACDEGKFHIYAVDSIHEALELFTGQEAGQADESGRYPKGTFLHVAQEQATNYWRMAANAEQ